MIIRQRSAKSALPPASIYRKEHDSARLGATYTLIEVMAMSYRTALSHCFDRLSPPAEILSPTASFPSLAFHELLFISPLALLLSLCFFFSSSLNPPLKALLYSP